MTSTNYNNGQKGFTIIEVMIVLAIAGIIMLLVFLAIPALQRNNRNTQIRSDVASVLGFANEYSVNNNGRLPGGICADGADGNVRASAPSSPCTGTSPLIGNIRGGITVTSTTAPSEPPLPGSTGEISIGLGYGCNDNNIGGAAPRTVAARFLIETAGEDIEQCQES